MDVGIKLIPSGSDFIENNWGGFYTGGNYLIYGEKKSGKTLLALNFIKSSLQQKKRCIYFTNTIPKKIIIQAASIGFDAEKYLNNESLILFKTPESSGDDEFLSEFYKNISHLVKKFNADRVVVDELTSYLNFINLRHMNSSIDGMIEELSEKNVTSIFLSKEPEGEEAELLLGLLKEKLTGSIHLIKDNSDYYSGKITITPNYGHTEGEFTGRYKIIPGKGFSDISDDIVMDSGNFYKSVSSLEEYLEYSNLYSYEDFLLILNNQISFCKVTKQKCVLTAVRTENKNGFEELRNMIWRISEKKNKISSRGKNILIFIKENSESFFTALRKETAAKNSILSAESVFISDVYIDENFSGAEELIEDVLLEKNFRPLKKAGQENSRETTGFTRYSSGSQKDFSSAQNKIQWR